MKQMILDIGVAPAPTLGTFVVGSNAAVLQHLRLWSESPTRSPLPTYLWGWVGSGKTHLLLAAREVLLARGATVGWLDAASDLHEPFDEAWEAVFMDDVHRYDAERQHLAFNWFINASTPAGGQPRAVLAAGAAPPADLPLRDDLRTRLGWGHVFELHCLSEAEMRAVLVQAAAARGIDLPREVLDYVLVRFARDLGSLMQLLEQLDRYALQSHRVITIPLLKSMLEGGGAALLTPTSYTSCRN